MSAKRYNIIKLAIGIAKGIFSFVLLLLFLKSGLSSLLEITLKELLTNQYIVFIFYVMVIGIAWGIIFTPINIYVGYFLEHKYDLSNQTFFQWVWEEVKGIFVGTIIGVPILLLFYFILNNFSDLWWLPFAIAMFIISVVLAQIVPVVVLPLFYKVIPLTDFQLKDRIILLAENAGMNVENIYKFNMSKNTKKANAAFTGLGRTKRIILGDTLLENYSLDEIETVIAHELGHFKRKHIVKNILIDTLFSFLTFFLMAKLYEISISWFNFESITQIAALPLLVLWGMLIAMIQTPVSNIISRRFEYEADNYAVETTRKPGAFIKTLEKLTEQNLGDTKPHPVVEWYFYSHPSIEKRKKNIELIKID